ncbi:MAG: hypothetical protein AB7L76_01575 [Burkholderiaceae bacterium]
MSEREPLNDGSPPPAAASTLTLWGRDTPAMLAPLDGRFPFQPDHVTNAEAVAQQGGCRYVDNLVEFVRGLEAAGERFDTIVFLGAMLGFSSESNVRYLLAAAQKMARQHFLIVERRAKLQARAAELRRAAIAVDLGEPQIDGDTSRIVVLRYETGRVAQRLFSLHEQRSLSAELKARMIVPTELLTRAGQALSERRGFSFVRLGHCENRLFGYGYSYGPSDAKDSYTMQFGRELDEDDTLRISAGMNQAIRCADVIGVPPFTGFGTSKLGILETSSFVHLRDFSLLHTKTLADVSLPQTLFVKQEFGDFLRRQQSLAVVGCRDVTAILQRSLNVAVNWHPVPAEFKFANQQSPPHYPQVFDALTAELNERVQPGQLYLVGAGLLGKLYCETIRRRGGVALDVGSFMDSLMGFKTRSSSVIDFEWVRPPPS